MVIVVMFTNSANELGPHPVYYYRYIKLYQLICIDLPWGFDRSRLLGLGLCRCPGRHAGAPIKNILGTP